MDGAEGVLLTIAGSDSLALQEVDEAARVVTERADDNAEIIFGQIYDDSLGDSVRVTVVAAGYGQRPNRQNSSLNEEDITTEKGDLPGFIQG